MGVMNLSLSCGDNGHEGKYDREGAIGVQVRAGQGTHMIRLVWSTEFGLDWQRRWNIAIAANATDRGKSTETGWVDFVEEFDAADCHPVQRYGGIDSQQWWWSHDLDVGGLMARMAGGSAWRFDRRSMDGITLRVWVHSWYVDGLEYPPGSGVNYSDTAYRELYINYVPEYMLDSICYDTPETVVVGYSCPGWERADDRYAFEGQCAVVGSGGPSSPLLARDVYGTVAALGRIEVPVDALRQHIKGKEVLLQIRFNASYRLPGSPFYTARAQLGVRDLTVCSTPSLSIKGTGETVTVGTADSGDYPDNPCQTVTVKMVGAKYAADQVTVPVGQDAVFRYCPFNVPLEFEAVGGTASGATSKASAAVAAPAVRSERVVLDSIRDGLRCALRYRSWSQYGPSVTAKGDFTTVKLSGRRRPSAFYGSGGTASVSFGGFLVEEGGSDWEELPYHGDVMCRFPDGRRYAIAASVQVQYRNPQVVAVSVSGDEVAA